MFSSLPHWLVWALAVAAATALVIGFGHFAFWRWQWGQGYSRPLTYIAGVGTLTAGLAVWRALVGPATAGEALATWGLIIGASGLVDCAGWAWHAWQARADTQAIDALARPPHD